MIYQLQVDLVHGNKRCGIAARNYPHLAYSILYILSSQTPRLFQYSLIKFDGESQLIYICSIFIYCIIYGNHDMRVLSISICCSNIRCVVACLQDLIPPSYVEELSLLQDQISPFATELAFDTIEKELGLPINVLFSEISPDPVAAASLGQVF